MNFYDPKCQERPINSAEFGLCDGDTIAYTNCDEPSTWIATVRNSGRLSLTFTAIDKCVIKDEHEMGRGRCDGMLTSSEHIFFVELKNQSKKWMPEAIDQLESTIQFFIEHHDIHIYKHKKAFACNKRRSRFQVINNELNLKFFRKYAVRLDIQAEIIVV